MIEIHHVASFAADDRIQPLDELVKNDPTFQADDLLPGILTNLRYRDKLYALPMNRSTPILYYNKDRFAAAGLDPNKPPATWQEVREMAMALTSDDRSEYGFVAVNSPWFFESMVWSNGGRVDGRRQADVCRVRGRAAAVVGRHGASRPYGAIRQRRFRRVRQRSSGDGGRFHGAVASVCRPKCQFKLGTAMLPRSEGSPERGSHGWRGGGDSGQEFRRSGRPRPGQFVTWFIKTQQAADWSEATGYIPVRESARTVLRTAGFYEQYPQFEVAIKQMAFVREAPQLPQWGAVWKIIEEAMTDGRARRRTRPANAERCREESRSVTES